MQPWPKHPQLIDRPTTVCYGTKIYSVKTSFYAIYIRISFSNGLEIHHFDTVFTSTKRMNISYLSKWHDIVMCFQVCLRLGILGNIWGGAKDKNLNKYTVNGMTNAFVCFYQRDRKEVHKEILFLWGNYFPAIYVTLRMFVASLNVPWFALMKMKNEEVNRKQSSLWTKDSVIYNLCR